MPKKSYPIARGIATMTSNGGYHSIGGIFVDTKSPEQRAAINQELDDSMAVLSAILGAKKTADEMQEALEAFCAPIEKDHGVACRGIIAAHFIGLQYSSNGKIYKEGISHE